METPRSPNRHRNVLVAALALSAVIHLVGAVVVRRLPPERPPNALRNPITITFNVPPPKQVSPAQEVPDQVPPMSKPPKAAPPKPTPPEPKPTGQVVKLPPPKDKQKPDQARYLSEHDHAVKEETRAKETAAEAAAAHEKQKDKGTPPPNPTPTPEEDLERGDENPDEEPGKKDLFTPRLLGGNPGANTQGLMSLWRDAQQAQNQGSAGSATHQPEDEPEQDRNAGVLLDGRSGASNKAPSGPPSLYPDSETLSRIAGGAPANDALDEPEGTGTYLNARQWKYAAYFNRVSDAVRRQWHPEAVLRRRRSPDLDGRVRRRFTLVEIEVNRQGKVVLARVDRYSGSDDLDDEGARAVRAAGPFPNPPEGLFDPGQETFTFKFGFTVTFERERSVVPFEHGVLPR